VNTNMSVQEFRAFGYLQEVNRQFFHPLGLALFVAVDTESGEALLGGILQIEDPEGMIFAEGEIDLDKAERVIEMQIQKNLVRGEALGYIIQSVRRRDA